MLQLTQTYLSTARCGEQGLKRKAAASMVRIMHEVVRECKRAILRRASAITVSLDDRGCFRIVRFRCVALGVFETDTVACRAGIETPTAACSRGDMCPRADIEKPMAACPPADIKELWERWDELQDGARPWQPLNYHLGLTLMVGGVVLNLAGPNSWISMSYLLMLLGGLVAGVKNVLPLRWRGAK